MAEKEEVYQPHFPALNMCVVIDARHSSRTDMIRDLKASNLFETIVEAKSIDDGTRVMQGHAVDACLLGPSVSLAKAKSFLGSMPQKSFSKDCAYVTLIPKDVTLVERATSHVGELQAAGAHGVIETPCTKKSFFESIVRAVVLANANTPWTGILLESEKFGVDPFPESGSHARSPNGAAESDAPGTSSSQKKISLVAAIQTPSPEMRDILEGIESGGIRLSDDGKPNKRTAAAIGKLVEAMLATSAGSSSSKFKQFFEQALVQYFLDLKLYGNRDATNELREKLLSYRE